MAEVIGLALLLAAAPAHLGPPVPARVSRVVTLAPSLSEVVLAVGRGDALAGVTRFDDDPRAAKLPRVGGYNDPEPEAVLRLRPDVVLAEPAPSNRGPIEALARVGIPVAMFGSRTVAEIEQTLVDVAALLGVRGRGEVLRGRIEQARAEARRRRGAPVKALLVFGVDPLVVAGADTFAGELLADVGGENVAGAGGFVRMSAESALRAAPQVIVLCGVELPAGHPVVPGLAGRVVPLHGTALLHPGPRIPEAIEDLRQALHQ